MMSLRESMEQMGGLVVKRRSRAQTVRKLAKMLAGRCESAFLFGSMASNTHTIHSDIDLCIIVKTRRPFLERFRAFRDILTEFAPIDLVIYTPEEVEVLRNTPTFFWKTLSKHTWPVVRSRRKG